MSDWPQSHGSQQLRRFRIAIRDGAAVEDAAALATFSMAEAQDWLRMDAENPPPPEAYVLLIPAATAAQPEEELTMPKHDAPNETPEPDFSPLVELTAETLRGDLRDNMLAWFKAQPKSWPFLNEVEQRDLASAIDGHAYALVRQAAKIIAAGERPTIVAKLVEYREKDGVEAKLKLASTGEVVAQLHEACGQEVLIVATGAVDFGGEVAPFTPDPDQRPLHGIGDEYDQAA